MPTRRLPNSVSAVIRTLKTARDAYKITPAADRPFGADIWAKLDDATPGSFLNRLLKEATDVDLALAAQAPLSSSFSQQAARLTIFVSHFHRVLDLGIARGTFAAGARAYYGRDISATTIPDLASYSAVSEAAEAIATGEAARAKAEGASYVPMSMPSAAEVKAEADRFKALQAQQQQATTQTDKEREELMALYPEGQALATDICDLVEFFHRKDPEASSRRAKCVRWGVVYVSDTGETPIPAPDPVNPTPTPTPTPTPAK